LSAETNHLAVFDALYRQQAFHLFAQIRLILSFVLDFQPWYRSIHSVTPPLSRRSSSIISTAIFDQAWYNASHVKAGTSMAQCFTEIFSEIAYKSVMGQVNVYPPKHVVD